MCSIAKAMSEYVVVHINCAAAHQAIIYVARIIQQQQQQ
jgi:hypothetical protein